MTRYLQDKNTLSFTPFVYYKLPAIYLTCLLQTSCHLLHMFITNILSFTRLVCYKQPFIWSHVFITNILSLSPFLCYKHFAVYFICSLQTFFINSIWLLQISFHFLHFFITNIL